MHMRDISLKPGTGCRFQMSGARRCPACLKEGRGQLRPDFESEKLRGSGAEARCRLQARSEEHTSELQSPCNLVCRLLLEKKKNEIYTAIFSRSYHASLSCSVAHA